jgi:hypothetical protein
MVIFREELDGLHTRLRAQRLKIGSAFEGAREAAMPEARAQAQEALDGRSSLTMESYQRLLGTLSPKGAEQLTKQIAHVKTLIKSRSGPRM